MYKFREIECPFCKHHFTWLEEPNGNSFCLYRRKGRNEELFSTVCPKCNLEMIVPDGQSVGIDIKDRKVEMFATVRGL